MSLAQPEPEEIPFQRLLNLVDRLSLEQRTALRQRLNKDTLAEWQALRDRVQERNQNLPPISDEEIVDALNEDY